MQDTITAEWIHEMVEQRQLGRLKGGLIKMEVHELAHLFSTLPDRDALAVAFRMLPKDTAVEIFGSLQIDQQKTLINTLSSDHVANIIREMPPDDRTELLEEMPGRSAQRLMNYLKGRELEIAKDLLAYPEDSIGRVMTPEYVAVRKDWSIEKVLRHIRRIAESRETFNIIYVVDDDWKLIDEIYLEDIILAEPDHIVEELMDNQFGALNVWEDQETAIEVFMKYDAAVMPVVDSDGTLVGIVTHDDIMDIAEEEVTEDIQMMAGVLATEETYLTTGMAGMMKKRLPWLVLLMAVEIVAVIILKGYQQILAVLAMFMPLINASAGNAGNQIAGLMIRSIAIREIQLEDWLKVLTREIFRGLAMGLILGLMAALITIILTAAESYATAAAVALAMTAAVCMANIMGSMLPFFFQGVGIDPAVTSGPLVTCLMDISSILIFFSIASAMLDTGGS